MSLGFTHFKRADKKVKGNEREGRQEEARMGGGGNGEERGRRGRKGEKGANSNDYEKSKPSTISNAPD